MTERPSTTALSVLGVVSFAAAAASGTPVLWSLITNLRWSGSYPYLNTLPNPVLVFAALLFLSVGLSLSMIARARVRERASMSEIRRCDQCGYDMSGLPILHTCPECGHTP